MPRTLTTIRKTGLALLLAVALMIGAPAAASADGPSTSQYAPTTSFNGGGGLPLTGLDAIAIAAIGAALAGTGIAVRKLSAGDQNF